MPEFGPHTRWSDPRLFDLVSKLRSGGVGGWGVFQKALLLGHEPWFPHHWNSHRVKAAEKLLVLLADSHLAVVVQGADGAIYAASKHTVREAGVDSVSIHMAGDLALARRPTRTPRVSRRRIGATSMRR